MKTIDKNGLAVAGELHDFLVHEALPGSGVDEAGFFAGLASLVADLAPRCRTLLARRDELQHQLDDWHLAQRGKPLDQAAYMRFLGEIGYLEPRPEPHQVATADVDPEIAEIAGPQLVVPISNARYALNAANARWGSLYDALYGTDAIPEDRGAAKAGAYNPVRGARVVAEAKAVLDMIAPLAAGSHASVASYRVENRRLVVGLIGGAETMLASVDRFDGYQGTPSDPSLILLSNNGLHAEIVIDRSHPIGRTDPAGVADVIVESAISSIMDMEDSVAAVDADRQGRLLPQLARPDEGHPARGVQQERRDRAPRARRRPRLQERARRRAAPARPRAHAAAQRRPPHDDGRRARRRRPRDPRGPARRARLRDRSRRHDLLRQRSRCTTAAPARSTSSSRRCTGRTRSPSRTSCSARSRRSSGCPRTRIKMGIMDEERRTSANLAACIQAASQSRVLHQHRLSRSHRRRDPHLDGGGPDGAQERDEGTTPWIAAYEDMNVDVGLACGLPGRAQIGKGMWAAPDQMALDAHDEAQPSGVGRQSTAWVPSPTAATLHALHYHEVDVPSASRRFCARASPRDLAALLTIPLAQSNFDPRDVAQELDNNVQGMLGYVVRWIDQGVGCSKVPDINNIGLMEDRATLRISSQHIANWLHHAIVSEDEVMAVMKKMAAVVDKQNAGDRSYQPMAPGFDGPAFRAACDLVFKGRAQPNGYTEFILTAYRREAKALAGDAGLRAVA